MEFYGKEPLKITDLRVNSRSKEMMFYQYMPIKMSGEGDISTLESRLGYFIGIVDCCCHDFVRTFGFEKYRSMYVYLTVKRQMVNQTLTMNRPGWHCDGFLTEDINYIWSDRNPTEFALGEEELIQDDNLSIKQMHKLVEDGHFNIFTYPDESLLRLDQYSIHRVGYQEPCMRTFVKVSLSADKYDLAGNTHNYNMKYDWHMKPRGESRNIPQSQIKK